MVIRGTDDVRTLIGGDKGVDVAGHPSASVAAMEAGVIHDKPLALW